MAITREPFAHLALIEVLSGDAVRAQFPVALIEGRTVVARVKIKTDRESLAPLEVRRDAWMRRVYDNVSLQAWGMWAEHCKMLLNEYRLNPARREDQELIARQLEQFFFGEGAAPPPDFKPQAH